MKMGPLFRPCIVPNAQYNVSHIIDVGTNGCLDGWLYRPFGGGSCVHAWQHSPPQTSCHTPLSAAPPQTPSYTQACFLPLPSPLTQCDSAILCLWWFLVQAVWDLLTVPERSIVPVSAVEGTQ